MHASHRATLLLFSLLFLAAAEGQAPPPAVQTIRTQAGQLEGLVTTDLARAFLKATSELPSIPSRVVMRDKTTRQYYSQQEAAALPEAARANLEEMELDESFYYNTRYGSPLAYARPLDVVAKAGFSSAAGRRILDFGYGGVGHLRLLASLGADAVGVEVDPLLKLLYGGPADQGSIAGAHGAPGGKLTLLHGQFPAEAPVKEAVGGNYDLFISKNVLKNGYIHPAEPVDPKRLVHLGVDDEAFLRTVHDLLKPGGFALVYNLSPAPAPPGKPYIPWADGRSPFPKELWEKSGFQVLAFDQDDNVPARALGKALGWDQGNPPMDLEKNLFGHYTLARRI